MAYRGDDLDLRTVQGYGAREPADILSAARSPGLSARGKMPLVVDDLVMAVINDAYEIALAHRALEVRIEHLLNAMTRFEASQIALEQAGVRVGSLRRETATIIASETPAGNGKGAPRTSEELEEVLRHAVEIADVRRAPAAIEDVLSVLFEPRRELAGLAVLRRHTQPRYREPVPGRTEAMLPPLARTFVADEPRERVRAPARSAYVPEAGPTITDSVQNTRIEALERLVRELSQDLAAERKTMSGVLGDLQRDIVTTREDTARVLVDRLQAFETTISSKQDGRGAASGERLTAIERVIDQRLGDIGRTFAALGDRLAALETKVSEAPKATVSLQPVVDRLAALEAKLGDVPRSTVSLQPVVDRLQALEQALAARQPDTQTPAALSAMSERIAAIDARTAETTKSVAGMAAKVTEDVAARVAGQVAGAVNEKLVLLDQAMGQQRTRIVEALTAQDAAGQRLEKLVTERLQAVAQSTGPLVERIGLMGAALESKDAAAAELQRQLEQRLVAIEQRIAAAAQRTGELHAARDKDVLELHDALVKINGNQQTLAASMDQWRMEMAGDVGVVANRMEVLERNSERPVQMLSQLNTDMQAMYAMTLKREQRKSRFRMWLFGTEDWYGDSWADGTAKTVVAAAPKAGSVPPTRR